MAIIDMKRYQEYQHYDMLHDFKQEEQEDHDDPRMQVFKDTTPEQSPSNRKQGMTKRAKERQHWSDALKIKYFNKFEMINMKTYKCRNKQNLSPIVSLDYDPKAMVRDPSKLFEPKMKAFNTIKFHMHNIEQASTSWMNERSFAALESMKKGSKPEI